MSDRNKTVLLESKVRRLKEMLLQQITFGKRMTDIVAKMDQLLTRKSIENEKLKKRLFFTPCNENQSDVQLPNSPTTKDVGDFSIDLEPPTLELIEHDVSEATVEVFEVKTETAEIPETIETKSELFSKKSEIFENHLFEKTETGELKCPYKENCTFVSKHRNTMRKHIRTHTGEKPYVCIKCKRAFARIGSIKKHVLVCTGPVAETTDLSELYTKEIESFENHSFEKTQTGELKCPYKEKCEFISKHRNTMRQHIRTHTGEKPYICKKCERTFAHLGSIKKHVLVCTGPDAEAIDLSELFEKKNETFEGHLFEKTECGELKCPYKESCTFVSNHRNNMRSHIRTHTGEKPYVCKICKNTFFNIGSVKRHLLTHSGMKGVNCKFCYHRWPASTIENHQTKCPERKRVSRKRARPISDSDH